MEFTNRTFFKSGTSIAFVVPQEAVRQLKIVPKITRANFNIDAKARKIIVQLL